ncbi:hypothetical protein NUW58_g9804 [Xylaria curta]|uniref:Uncharacterized protein n=1 Tax=Xylaria curta TaxID=42375 RepID=A0ACC1MSW2_9PEZI|nr:hypothetical protein NUW58_g9804 [Xylaria curta]
MVPTARCTRRVAAKKAAATAAAAVREPQRDDVQRVPEVLAREYLGRRRRDNAYCPADREDNGHRRQLDELPVGAPRIPREVGDIHAERRPCSRYARHAGKPEPEDSCRARKHA